MNTPQTPTAEPLAPLTGSAFVSVAAIAPFWRYAVGPTSGNSPAVPYYRLASAIAFFEEAKAALPWAGVALYKRSGFRGIETVCEYSPNAPHQATVSEKL